VREPDFVGVGAQKCGSTSIVKFLRTVGVRVPKKELHYFNRGGESPQEYLTLFSEVPEGMTFGEFTPDYFYSSRALLRMSLSLRSTRYILSLRDPISRFYSGVNHGRGEGNIPAQWPVGRVLDAALSGRSRNDWLTSLVWKGQYGTHVERTLSLLGREKVHVVFLEEITSPEMGETVQRNLLDFIGVSLDDATPVFPQVNESAYHLRQAKIRRVRRDALADARLRDLYSRSNDKLRELLGRALPWDS
jgi:hypothetical protein